jgi:hypothetical protein
MILDPLSQKKKRLGHAHLGWLDSNGLEFSAKNLETTSQQK